MKTPEGLALERILEFQKIHKSGFDVAFQICLLSELNKISFELSEIAFGLRRAEE